MSTPSDDATSPDEAAVLAAADAFYTAFEALDFQAMAACWAQRDDDVCIHPGWEILRGWGEISASWRSIFANTGFMRFEATDVSVEVTGDVGRVTNIERIFSVADTHTTHGAVAATSLFLRTPDGWKMTLHHGSPIAATHQVTDLDEGGLDN